MSGEHQTSDIASVLRDYLAGNPDARGQVEFVDASDLRDAASEIDRLRAALLRIATSDYMEGEFPIRIAKDALS